MVGKKRIVGLLMVAVFLMFSFPLTSWGSDSQNVIFIGTVKGGSYNMQVNGTVQEDFYAVMGSDLSKLGAVFEDWAKGAGISQLRVTAKNNGVVTGIVKAGAETEGQLSQIPPDNIFAFIIYVKSGTFTADSGQVYKIVNRIATPINSEDSSQNKSEESGINLMVNGQILYPDVPPVLINGRTMVPVRVVAEALGLTVDFDSATQTVIAQKDDTKVELILNGKAYKNGQEIALDVPATIIEGRTVAPVRFIAEAFGADVSWDNSTRTVSISQ